MLLCLSVSAVFRPLINKKFFKEVFSSNWRINTESSSRYGCVAGDKNCKKNVQNDEMGDAMFSRTLKGVSGGGNPSFCKHCRSLLQRRSFSTNPTVFQQPQNGEKGVKSYELMQFQWIIWPSLIYSIKNWILSRLIIRPYLDKDFTMTGFEKGARQAMLLVTSLLSKGKLDSLCGLVSDEALSEIEKNYVKLDADQRRELSSVTSDDVYFSFPYQVGIMLEDADGVQKRVVEITMCFHCLLGSQDIKRTDLLMTEIYKYKEKLLIVNYRFIKEFTKGRETDWTINIVNYFKPAQLL